MMEIYIDATQSQITSVRLYQDGKEIDNYRQINTNSTRNAIPVISKILIKHKINIADIKSVRVSTGPGSFTGLRVGMVIAKTLSIMLGIPLNGGSAMQNIPLEYETSRFDG